MPAQTGPHIQLPAHLPFLEAICWQQDDIQYFTQDEMLNCYERGWKYRGVLEDLKGEELVFVQKLALAKGSWLVADV